MTTPIGAAQMDSAQSFDPVQIKTREDIIRDAAERAATRAIAALSVLQEAVVRVAEGKPLGDSLRRRLATAQQYLAGRVPSATGAPARYYGEDTAGLVRHLISCDEAYAEELKYATIRALSATDRLQHGKAAAVDDADLDMLRAAVYHSDAAREALESYNAARSNRRGR